MPKLEKDPHYRNLYRHPHTKIFYVRKYAGKTHLYRSLRTRSRKEAIEELRKFLQFFLHPEQFENEEAEERRQNERVFENIVVELRSIYATKAEATRAEFDGFCNRYLLPFYRGLCITEVGKKWESYCAMQKELWRRKLHEDPKFARKHKGRQRKLQHDRKVLRVILNFAVRRGYLEAAPELQLDASERTPRVGYVYSDAEIIQILENANPGWKLRIDFQVRTGLRPGEVRLCRYDYINFETGFAYLPAEIIKTRKDRIVKLDAELLQRLRERKAKSNSPYVFPHRFDPKQPASKTDKTWQRLKKKYGIKGTLHHFRHTAATRAVQAGIPLTVVESQLGMSHEVLKRTYLHANEEQAENISKAVTGRIAKAMRDKIGDKSGNSLNPGEYLQ
jgi:integrase